MKRFIYLTVVLLAAASNSLGQKRLEATDVDFCNLIHQPADYDQKILRVRTFYIVGFEGSIFNKQDCGVGDVWVRFDPSYEKATNRKILKKFNKLADAGPEKTADGGTDWPTRMVEVVAVGRFDGVKKSYEFGTAKRFQGFGHNGAFDSQFTVLAIEAGDSIAQTKKIVEVPNIADAEQTLGADSPVSDLYS